LTAATSLGNHDLALVVEEHADLFIFDLGSVNEDAAKVHADDKLHHPSHQVNVVYSIKSTLVGRFLPYYGNKEVDDEGKSQNDDG